MKRSSFLVVALAVTALACKSESSSAPAPAPAASATPPTPHAAAPAAPGQPPNAHGTDPRAAQTAPRPLEKRADGRVALGPFTMVVPDGWKENPSTSSMRAAEFELPAAGGGEGEVIVYHFGSSGAGSVQANIDRWVSQFKQPDGRPSKEVAKIEKAQFAGQESSVVSVSGRYVAPAMPGGQPQDKQDQALVAAIVPSPQGPYYFRLIGSKATVAEQEAAFRKALESLKLE